MNNSLQEYVPFQRKELAVSRWVNNEFDYLTPNISLKEAAQFMIERDLNEVPIMDLDRIYLGMLALKKVTQAILDNNDLEHSIAGYYDCSVEPLSITEALSFVQLSKEKIPVVDQNGLLIGMLDHDDVLKGFSEDYEKMDTLEKTMEWFHICFDHIYEGIVFVDENGFVKMINKAYCNYLGVKQEEAIGQYITNVIEGTRLHIVLQTGIPENNQVQILKGQEVVAHRIPIWKNNQIIGGIGILAFQGVSELYKIFDRIQEFHGSEELSNLPIELPRPKEPTTTTQEIVGKSWKFSHAKHMAYRAAPSDASILITGESGVGKEVFTKAIHSMSKRSRGPLVSVNCAAIPEQLLESELFGYEEGAFTGAKRKGKPGKFLLAHKGTIFLDEIGDMPLEMQSKLLRVLEEREVEPVGASKAVPVDFRLIAATNRSIPELIKENKFRADLYYRLNVIPISIPPLRERREDIPLFIGHYMRSLCKHYQIPEKEISKETVAKMIDYDWPGNVRELKNVIERLIVLTEDTVIGIQDFNRCFKGKWSADTLKVDLAEKVMNTVTSLEKLKITELNKEKQLILSILQEENNNKTKTAKRLGISRGTLYNKLKEFNL